MNLLSNTSSGRTVVPVTVSTSFITFLTEIGPTVSNTYPLRSPSAIALISLSILASNKGSAQETGALSISASEKISANLTPLYKSAIA